jgi:hypothetical protein
MIKLENQIILVISNEPWGKMWFSKHNWANELSNQNKVFFINPPKKWSLKHFFSDGIIISKYSESLNIVDYYNRLPFTRNDFVFRINEGIIVKSLIGKLKKKKDFIFWSFDPYRFSSPQLFKPLKSIFFRVDIFLFKNRERKLIKNVDGVIVTAKELLKGVNAKNELIISHGIAEAEFICEKDIEYQEGFLLYVGQIDHRLDVLLIKKMLIEFPNEQFIFMGSLLNIKNDLFQELFYQNKYKNLIIHGAEHFKNLKNYISKSKACLVPMDLSVHGNGVHHHKSLQYLAMGKPVISPIFNDKINNDEFILGYKTEEEAISIINNINISETSEKIENRINFAKQFLYTNLITKVEDFLSAK